MPKNKRNAVTKKQHNFEQKEKQRKKQNEKDKEETTFEIILDNYQTPPVKFNPVRISFPKKPNDLNSLPTPSSLSLSLARDEAKFEIASVSPFEKVDFKYYGLHKLPSHMATVVNIAIKNYVDHLHIPPSSNSRNSSGFVSYHFGGWKRKGNPVGLSSDLTRKNSINQRNHTFNLLNAFKPVAQYLDRLFSADFPLIHNRYSQLNFIENDSLDWIRDRPIFPWAMVALTVSRAGIGSLQYHIDSYEDREGLVYVVVFGDFVSGGELEVLNLALVVPCSIGTIYAMRGYEWHRVRHCFGGDRYSLVFFTDKYILDKFCSK